MIIPHEITFYVYRIEYFFFVYYVQFSSILKNFNLILVKTLQRILITFIIHIQYFLTRKSNSYFADIWFAMFFL